MAAPGIVPRSWWPTLACLGLALAAIVVLHYAAASRAVALWWESPTYSFAFLIAPLAVYLVAMKTAPTPPARPAPLLLLLHLPIIAFWFLAVAVEVIEAQQFALLGAIYVTIVSILGFRVAFHHAVALLLLAFLVPTGQFIVPALQHLSADMAVGMLRVWGVPLFQDDLIIQLPESSYFVAPGCAGLNFVLVSIVLGLVVGELFYKGIVKRIAVVAGLVGVALVANPVRIFAIIAIDHATNRTTDIVSDHLTYGWAFFAVVLAICLPVALQYRDDLAPDEAAVLPEGRPTASGRVAATALAGVMLAAVGPVGLLAAGLGRERAISLPALPAAPSGVPGQSGPWLRTTPGVAEAKAQYELPAGGQAQLDVALRLAPTPQRRLLDAWPPPGLGEDNQPDRRHTLAGPVGSMTAYTTVAGSNRRYWVVCYVAAGACLPDGGAYRRAILKVLPSTPLATTGVVVASMPAPPQGDPRNEASFKPLADIVEAAMRSLGPALAKR